MNKIVKNGVHPGFVEIIKQLSPDEAKILRYMKTNTTIPTITLRYEDSKGTYIEVIKNFSLVGEYSKCESPFETAMYFDNLIRLGLLYDADGMSSLTDEAHYHPLTNHSYITAYYNDEIAKKRGFEKAKFQKSWVSLTEFGKSFCEVCITF